MLLLFWKTRAPSFAVAALSARPSGTSAFVRARIGQGRASAVAGGTAQGVRSELNTVAVATMQVRSRAAVVGLHAAEYAAEVQLTALLTASGISPGHEAAGSLAAGAHTQSAGRRASLAGTGSLRGHPDVLASGVRVGHRGRLRISAKPRGELTAVRYISPRIPMQELAPVDLGTTYRGDTMILPVWMALTREGEPYDLEGGVLRFTAKEDLVLPDTAPHVIQCNSLPGGGITILDPPLGNCYRVQIEPIETKELLGDTVFTFDVQLFTDSANVYTIRRGLITVVRDVTRAPI